LSRIVSASWNTSNGVLTLTRNDGSTIPVDLDNRYLQSYSETDTLQSVTTRGNSTNQDIIISKTSAKLRLHEPNTSDQNFPSLEFDTDNNQGIALSFNEFDSQVPIGGYGIVVGPSSTNTQFPTVGAITFNVLGEIYAGGNTLGSLSKVWHAGNFNPNNYLQISNYVDTDNYVDSVAFNTSTGVLTLGRTGSLSNLTVDLDGRYFNQTDSDARYVRQLGIVSSPDYQVASSRRVDPNTSNPTSEHYAISTFGNEGNVTGQLATHFVSGQAYTRGYNSSWSTWRKIWDSQNFNPATYDNGRFVKKTGDTMTGVLTFNRSATRQIINLNTTAGAHSLGWEPYHNTYGPDTWNSGFIAHKFYSNANTLTATIGTGGASGSTVSTFYGRTDFPAGLTSQTLDIGYTGDRTIQALSTDKSFGTYGDLHLQHYGGDLHAVHGGGVIYDNGSRVFSDRYHPNADKWTTARTNTVTLTGDATGSGSASVDGSGNWTVSVPVTVGNNSHNHTTLTGVTSIGFNAQSSDSASISTTINGSGTYFDFNLTDDNNNDWWRWRFTPSGSTVYDAMVLKPISNGNANLIVSGSITADSFSGSINYNQITNPPADVDNYADSVSFNTSNGILTIGRTGSLADLTVDLDGRYITSETDSQTLSWNGSTGQLSISNGNTVDLDNRYFTESESDSRYVNVTGDTMSGQLTVNSDVVVTGDLKLNGSDSYIWTPNTSGGYTGFWDQFNARLALHYTNSHSGWGVMGQSESGTALKVHGNTKVTGGLEISGSLARGSYPSLSQYHTGADNIVLKGNSSGISTIFFESEKDGTNINHPSDFGFIQYHAYGTAATGEANELIIGVSNDADDNVIINAPNVNGFKFRTGPSATDHTVWHAGNLNPSNYLTSYSETDTLGTVTGRDNTTNSTMIIRESSAGGFEFRTNDSWGSWARNTHSISTGGGTHLYAFGGYGGSGTSLGYAWLGKGYDDTNIRMYPDGETQLFYNNSRKLVVNAKGAKVGTTNGGASSTIISDLDTIIELGVQDGTGAGQAANYPSASGVVFHHGGTSTAALKHIQPNISTDIFKFTSDRADTTLEVDGRIQAAGALRVTETGTAQHILIGNQDSGGANRPSMIRGVNGGLHIGYGNSWSGEGGTMTTTIESGTSKVLVKPDLHIVNKIVDETHQNYAWHPDPEGTGTYSSHRFSTSSGYVDIGPKNTTYAHMDTDRPKFYFNKRILVDEGIISSFNEDLYLRRAESSADQIHISTTTTTISQDTVIQGNLTVNGSISQGDDFGKLYTYNVNMGLSTGWANVPGIAGGVLPTGTYAIQIKVDNYDASGGNYSEHYSGTMAWYGGSTNDGDSNEIPLHNAGHAYNGHAIYARTLRRYSSSMVLQLAASGTISADSIEIKIRKLI
jgi:hypothetical protein